MSSSYFSLDGNWGSAEGLLILTTKRWTDKMFEAVSEESDSDRADLARHFSEGEHSFDSSNGGLCDDCGLEACELGMTEFCTNQIRYQSVTESGVQEMTGSCKIILKGDTE
jgi:hypothetical protein